MNDQKQKLRGVELFKTGFNKILANPECWNQSDWHCGSKHCFFGHLQLLAGGVETTDNIVNEVANYLQISTEDATWLSARSRTLPQIRRFGVTLSNKTDVDPDGYDPDGYDRHDCDRHGYDRHGYDRHGYDRHGFNHVGYNRDGFNRVGYDRDGYDRYCYDRAGRKLLPL
jgi:hypothetical protein